MSRRGPLGGGFGIVALGALALYLISEWGKRRALQRKAQEAARALRGVRLF